MSLSPVELAERSASNRALRETIGRQLKAEYNTAYALPDHLLELLQQLQRANSRLNTTPRMLSPTISWNSCSSCSGMKKRPWLPRL